VVEACRARTRKPLITKLSPNQTDIAENARRWLGDSWADAPASADPDADGFTFRVANRIFRYDRFGLRRDTASQ